MNVLQTIGLKKYYGSEPNITRALIIKPAIVLADEPAGNLDSKTGADVLGLLKHISMEFHQTIVMITRNNEIARLADRIVRIEDGRIAGGGQARKGGGRSWHGLLRMIPVPL